MNLPNDNNDPTESIEDVSSSLSFLLSLIREFRNIDDLFLDYVVLNVFKVDCDDDDDEDYN